MTEFFILKEMLKIKFKQMVVMNTKDSIVNKRIY